MKKFIIGIITLLLLAGCGGKPVVSDPTHATGEGLAKIEVLGDQAQKNVVKAIPHSDKVGKVHLGSADEQLTDLRKELNTVKVEQFEVRKAFATQQTELQELREDHVRLEGKWYVIGGRWIERILIWALLIAIVFRIGSQFVGGTAGGLLAGASTMILGIITAGVSLIQMLFDNIFFRITKKKLEGSGGTDGKLKRTRSAAGLRAHAR